MGEGPTDVGVVGWREWGEIQHYTKLWKLKMRAHANKHETDFERNCVTPESQWNTIQRLHS